MPSEWPGTCPLLQGNFLDPSALRAWTERVAPGWPRVLMDVLVWSGLPSSACLWPPSLGHRAPRHPLSPQPVPHIREAWTRVLVHPAAWLRCARSPPPLPHLLPGRFQLSGHGVRRSWPGWPTTSWCLQGQVTAWEGGGTQALGGTGALRIQGWRGHRHSLASPAGLSLPTLLRSPHHGRGDSGPLH